MPVSAGSYLGYDVQKSVTYLQGALSQQPPCCLLCQFVLLRVWICIALHGEDFEEIFTFVAHE